MTKQYFEAFVGVIVLVVVVMFSYKLLSVNKDSYAGKEDLLIKAKFSSLDGITKGSEIKIAGLTVGKVVDIQLDSSYTAVASMAVKKGIAIPTDSSVAVNSSGLLGNKFLSITPGAETEMLENGGTIEYTQSSINFESIINKLVTGYNTKKEEEIQEKEKQPKIY